MRTETEKLELEIDSMRHYIRKLQSCFHLLECIFFLSVLISTITGIVFYAYGLSLLTGLSVLAAVSSLISGIIANYLSND